MVVNRLTKSARFIPIKFTYSVEIYAKIFKDIIVIAMVFRYPSYRIGGEQCTSRFWRSFQKVLDTKVEFSIDFHPPN